MRTAYTNYLVIIEMYLLLYQSRQLPPSNSEDPLVADKKLFHKGLLFHLRSYKLLCKLPELDL